MHTLRLFQQRLIPIFLAGALSLLLPHITEAGGNPQPNKVSTQHWDRLQTLLAEKGTVRVIVGLQNETQSGLPSQATNTAYTTAIAAMQDQVLARLPAKAASNSQKFNNFPAFAIERLFGKSVQIGQGRGFCCHWGVA